MFWGQKLENYKNRSFTLNNSRANQPPPPQKNGDYVKFSVDLLIILI